MKKARSTSKIIRQSVTFIKTSPHEVYESLIDSKRHATFTQSKAEISKKVGGKFKVWGSYISGSNIELVKDKKIVQKWRAKNWPLNHFSKATFSLRKVKGGTNLIFTQSGVPGKFYEDIKQGWISQYWKRMKAYFLRD